MASLFDDYQLIFLPLCCFHSLFPVLQGQLEPHLLDQRRHEARIGDYRLVDQLQCTAVVVPHRHVAGLSDEGLDGLWCGTVTRW